MNAVLQFHRDTPEAPYVGVLNSFVRSASESVSRSRIAVTEFVHQQMLQEKVSETVAWAEGQRSSFAGVADMAQNLAEMLRLSGPIEGAFVDADLTLTDSATELLGLIYAYLPDLRAMRASINGDTRLSYEQKRALATGFDDAIRAVECAHSGLESMIAAVDFHDEAVASMSRVNEESLLEAVRRVHGEDGVEFLSQLRDAEGSDAFTVEKAREAFLSER